MLGNPGSDRAILKQTILSDVSNLLGLIISSLFLTGVFSQFCFTVLLAIDNLLYHLDEFSIDRIHFCHLFALFPLSHLNVSFKMCIDESDF